MQLQDTKDQALDWLLDRTVLPGYTKIGYSLRGLDGDPVDPEGRLKSAQVLVTGANSGLGFATTKLLARAGASVQMLVRDAEKGEEAKREIEDEVPGAELELLICDLSSLETVRDAASTLRERIDNLDAIVHNAGLMVDERQESEDGFELTLAVHVLGPYLLSHELLPLLKAGAPSRIVFVTSGGMYTERLRADDLQLESRDFDGTAFYAHAKRVQVVLTEELDDHLPDGVTIHAMHPGWAATPGVEKSLPTFNKVLSPVLRDAEEGADTAVWLCAATEPLERSGQLWMDRKPRPFHRVPWTREDPAERERTLKLIQRMVGIV